MGLTDRLLEWVAGPSRAVQYNQAPPAVDNFLSYITLAAGGTFPYGLNLTMPGGYSEEIGGDFSGLINGAYKANGVVFACMLARLMIFSEARFQFRTFTKGRPGRLFGDSRLDILEHPWPGGTTGDLLSQMIVDADLAGNAFLTIRKGQVKRMRPDWVEIVIGSPNSDADSWDLDAEVLGFVYYPGGKHSGRDPVALLRETVAHFKPIPDPQARFRGMSWLTPIIREVMADGAATTHKLKFFENGATPNLVVSRPESMTKEVYLEWVKVASESNAGLANAYKSLYLMGGATATVVGADLKQLDFKVTQGAGETRIAAAAGIHPVIVGLSEGMQGSSLNAGNFNSARRLVADRTMRPLWRNAAGSLETLVPPPSANSQLWYDENDIAFLREDRKDAAEIQQVKAASIRQLVDAGYKPETVVNAIDSEDMTLLKHSGLFSVQLQPPGSEDPTEPVISEKAPTNGTKPVVGAKP